MVIILVCWLCFTLSVYHFYFWQEVLAVYLQQYPDSAVALNLKACNHFRLYNGKAAEVCECADTFIKLYHQYKILFVLYFIFILE